MKGLTQDEIKTSLAEDSLSWFIRFGWHVLEPSTEYNHNWHIDAISEHLEAVTRNEIQNLIINISPRCMKSLSVAVYWPVWAWISRPASRWMFATYAQSLTVRDSIKRRNLILSPWYQERWGDIFSLTRDQNAKVRFDNDKTGFMLATSVDGSATGEGADVLIVDDPLKASESLSEASRNSVNTWWDQTMSTRLNDRKTGARVIIMQRLHEADLVGHLLAKMEGGGTHYEHLMLPMEFDEARKCFFSIPVRTSLGGKATVIKADPRSEQGELMWSSRMDRADVSSLKADLGEYAAAAQLQQTPAPEGGGQFKDHWWRFWVPADADLANFQRPSVQTPDGLHHFELVRLPPWQHGVDFLTFDCTFKGKETSDYVAGLAIRLKYPNFFVMDQVHEKMDIIGTIRAIKKMSARYPQAMAKIIEDKANGPAIIQLLQGGISSTDGEEMEEVRGVIGQGVPGLIPYNPETSKPARAAALAPVVEAGNVLLPHPQIAPWVWKFIAEFSQFPYAAHDDRVDALGQGVQYGVERYGRKKTTRAIARG